MPQGASVAIQPTAPTVLVGATVAFSASVYGIQDPGVRWSVKESDGGSIEPSGRYFAPSGSGTYHVVATSAAEPGVSAVAIITVVVAPPTTTDPPPPTPNGWAIRTGPSVAFPEAAAAPALLVTTPLDDTLLDAVLSP